MSRIKFEGDRCWWTIRAENDRYQILTRQADFKPKGEVFYTIVDREEGIRGPCNLIGQGWGFDAETLDADAKSLLEALELARRRAQWRDEHPPTGPAQDLGYGLKGWRTEYPPELANDDVVEVEISHRNRIPVRIEATETDACERLRQAEERLAKREEWLEILDRAAGFGSLADVAAHQRELGVEGDHETRLRQKRVDLLRDLIATAAAQEADSASWQAADD